MKIVRLFDIRWDTDNEDPDKLGLPNEHVAVMDDDWILKRKLPTFSPTPTDFCVEGCSYKVLDNPNVKKSDLWGSERGKGLALSSGHLRWPDTIWTNLIIPIRRTWIGGHQPYQ